MDTKGRTNPLESPMESSSPRTSDESEKTVIGAAVTITGDLTAEEDLVIQGTVDGTIIAKEHQVTIAKEGRIKGNTLGKTLIVEGTVEGDLHGGEKVVIRPTGEVRGSLFAPRVSLEDGCRFKGKVSMDTQARSLAVEPVAATRRAGKHD